MPTDTAPARTAAARFAARAAAWSLGAFGLLRLHWTEAHVVLPLTGIQAWLAVALFGTSDLPVQVTLACSGVDAVALCLGAILAYPTKWHARLAGAAGGVGLIVALNILRIGSLGRVAASPALFNVLHVYLWPAALTLVITGYVFRWMQVADRPRGADANRALAARVAEPPPATRRFVVLTAVFLVLFSVASPLYLESASVLALAGFIARTAAIILGGLGVTAHAAANVLWTPRGGFLVTQECISTPLVPVYVAGVCAYLTTWPHRTVALLATLPLFIVLGIARLLVVALPDALVASPLFLVHAFYQLLLAAVVVTLAAVWRHGGQAALHRASSGVVVGILFVYLLGPSYTRVVTYATGPPLDDPQAAIAFLPVFQVGLYLALWIAAFVAVGWKRFLAGLAILELTQMTGLLALQALARHSDVAVHVRDVRAWAVAGPLLIATIVVNVWVTSARPTR